jgi:outer membrane protein insertion porin family
MIPSMIGRRGDDTLRWARLLVLLMVGGVGLLLLPFPATAQAQDEEPPVIEAVVIEGAGQTPEVFVRGIVQTGVGSPLDRRLLDVDVARLLRTGRFFTVTYRIEPLRRGVQVVFELTERTMIQKITFVGNDEYGESRLKKELPFKEGRPMDPFLVRQGMASIRALYREDAYNDVQISYDEDLLRDTGELRFTIREGVQSRIDDIEYVGAETYSEWELDRQIESETAWWFFRTGAFDPEVAQNDAVRLQRYYRDHGFLDASVTYRSEVSEDGEDVTLIFDIEEGTLYHIERVEFKGNTVYDSDELERLMALQPGKIIRRQQLDQDLKTIQNHYGQYGYIYTVVQATPVFSEQPGLVVVTINIDEGGQYRVGAITARGNTNTKDKVVRRALNLYPPDDLINTKEIEQAERELRSTGIFSSVRIYPVGDEPDRRDLIVDVEEAEKVGDFLFGFGVTSNSGVVGSLVLDLKNFDWQDTPESFSEFYRFRSFRGAGQRLRLELQPGTEVTRARITFTEPYLMDRPLRLSLGAYLFTRGRDTYDESRVGANASLGKRFESGWLQGWSTETAVRVENVTIDEIKLFSARDVYDVKGDNFVASVKQSFVLDRTDSRYIPTKGDRWQFSYEQVGGDDFFGKLRGSYTWHTTLSVDMQERPTVLSLNAQSAYILGSAPLYERYYAGGVGSMRGFAFRGIGERDGIQDTNIGGKFLLLTSGEYSFPLYGESLRGVFFVDMGTVESDIGLSTWRAAVGTGVRVVLDLLGPIPIELDLAVPVLRDEDDDERYISFFVGTTF